MVSYHPQEAQMKAGFPPGKGKLGVSDRRLFIVVAVQVSTGCGTGEHKSILVAVQVSINRPSLQYLQILQRYLKTTAGVRLTLPPACLFLPAGGDLIERAWQKGSIMPESCPAVSYPKKYRGRRG
jgi:hypothetical protein